MNRDQLVDLIEEIEVGKEVIIRSSTFGFGLKAIEELDEVVIIFGGYGNHYSIWGTDVYDSDYIADRIIEHMNGYHSEITGNIELSECEIEY